MGEWKDSFGRSGEVFEAVEEEASEKRKRMKVYKTIFL